MTTPTPFSGMTANDIIANALAGWGLSSLTSVVQGYNTQGLSSDESYLQLVQTPQYKQRFAGNDGLRAKGLTPLTEAEYLARETSIDQQFRGYQLPPGFVDSTADKAKLIGGNVGGQELDQRLSAAQAVVTDGAMSGVLAYAQQNYGLGTGDLMAYFLDPQKSAGLLTKQAAASQVGAAAARTGFGAVDTATAERLAGEGVTATQAASGFSQAAGLDQLTADVGDSAAVSRDDLTKAFVESDAKAQQRVARTQQTRQAAFQGGGSFASTNKGVAGLGSANT
jgi:hypothetical protein